MYKLFINLIVLYSLNFLLADDIDALFNSNHKKTNFNFIDDAKSLNDDLKNNLEETSQKQRKLIAKLFAFDIKYSLSMAQGYCSQIKDENSRLGCMSGIYLAREDISMAQGYCSQIKDEDSRLGCMSGIYLAKEDISMAQGYCSQIKDEDSRLGCMSGVNITGFFLQKEKEENEYQARRINNLDNNINQTQEELSKDQQEALEIIKELEANPELLKDPKRKILYQQLKGSLE